MVGGAAMPQPNFIDKLTAVLPAAAREALDVLILAAGTRSLALYAVGGCVRDLLLERPPLDLDLTLEGDAPALAPAAPSRGPPALGAGPLPPPHEASFRDDAPRILRGARYEARLGFRFQPQTLRWLRRDIRYLDTISGRRLRDELLRVLREPRPERILMRLHGLGALGAVPPSL